MDQINSLCSEGFAKVRIDQVTILSSVFAGGICYSGLDHIETKHESGQGHPAGVIIIHLEISN